MNRLMVIGLAFVLWTVGAVVVGWQLRDGSADLAASDGATATQEARADVAEDARATDQANSATATQVEQGRVEAAAVTDTQFRIIEREVVKYVQANPDPVGCELDGDGLRAWRQANAGPFAQPDRTAVAAGDPGGTAPATGER